MAHPVKIPAEWLKPIVEELHPEQIWLFGSHARGDSGPSSDWDFLVVLSDDAPDELLDSGHIWNACIRKLPVPADVIPVRESEFATMRAFAGSLCRTVALEGQQIYGEVVPPNPITLAYLQAAEEDLDAARRLFAPPANRLGSYHLQQTAEKLAKAVLTGRGIHPTKEHRLSELSALLPNGDPWKNRLDALAHLDRFATTFRYPGTSGRLQPGEESEQAARDTSALAQLLLDARSEVGIGR
jgi:uncharacterized protein